MDLVSYWEEKKKLLDEALRRAIRGEEAEAIDVARYIVEGGKRFRGILVLLTAEALGGDPLDALNAAVAVELVHASSLAIDDIVDRDTVRRGQPAAWIMHGIAKTVLVSNYLIPLAQKMVEKYGFEAVRHTIRAWLDVTRGEILDVFVSSKTPYNPGLYRRITELKTGSLFRLSINLGLAAAGKSGEGYEEFSEYGLLLGIAYQVADDIVDLKLVSEGALEEWPPVLALAASWMLGRKAELPRDAEEAYRAGIVKLRTIVSMASEKASILPVNKYSDLLSEIPGFMAEKMLGEAGLSLGVSLKP